MKRRKLNAGFARPRRYRQALDDVRVAQRQLLNVDHALRIEHQREAAVVRRRENQELMVSQRLMTSSAVVAHQDPLADAVHGTPRGDGSSRRSVNVVRHETR